MKLYISDIDCGSCIQNIDSTLKETTLQSYSIDKEAISFSNTSDSERIKKIIESLGHRVSTSPFEKKTLKDHLKLFRERSDSYPIERRGIKQGIGVFLALLFFSIFAYTLLFQGVENFIGIYGWWIFYLIISITFLSVAIWHFHAYNLKVGCMTGMMIGMTLGMQTGMMIGLIIGVTNGFFVGSMVGVTLGTIVGVFSGKCCGVMGVMEGAMAGVMGGTMGPMIGVMMFLDNILLFMPLYMIINVGILLGFSYMLYEEFGKEKNTRDLIDGTTLISLSLLVMGVLIGIMVYGPSSSFLGGL